MNAVDIIKEALKAIEEAEVPDDLRVVAFERVVDLLTAAQHAAPQATDSVVASVTRSIAADADSLVQRISQRLGISYELVSEVFHEDGDTIGIGLAASKFPKSKAAATKQIALLTAASRQVAGLEEWTPTGAIREMCRDYGKFDTANFATTIRSMGNAFSFRGKAQQLEVKVTRPGLEQAARLIQELRGNETG